VGAGDVGVECLAGCGFGGGDRGVAAAGDERRGGERGDGDFAGDVAELAGHPSGFELLQPAEVACALGEVLVDGCGSGGGDGAESGADECPGVAE
jgi:hypothetical protein